MLFSGLYIGAQLPLSNLAYRKSAPKTWASGKGQTDRVYWQVIARAPGDQWDLICDIYQDQAQGVWVMDRVLD